MKRYHLSKKRLKEIRGKLAMDVWPDGKYEMLENDLDIILVDGIPAFFEYDGKFYPTVLLLLNNPVEGKAVTVDMGAVKHVLNGANVFAAGIVDADSGIAEGDAVFIRDVKYGKPLAVGIAQMSGEEMVNANKGVAVKTLHYYGDKIQKIME